MLINKRGFRVFNEYDLGATLESQLIHAKKEIKKDVEELKAGEQIEYIKHQTEKLKVSPIDLDVSNVTVTVSEQMISAEYFPSSGFLVERGESYPKQVYTFHLPFKGDPILLRSVPSTRILWTEDVALEDGEIIFEIIDFYNNADDLKKERDRVVGFLVKQAAHVNQQVDQYNNNLSHAIEEVIKQTTGKLSQQSDILSQLGNSLKVEKTKEVIASQAQSEPKSKVIDKKSKHFGVFICHASEDKEFVNSLAAAIKNANIEPWYDDFQLGWGDDLRPAIDSGLQNSSYGIVVFSKAFLAKKKWTEYELNGLLAREKQGQKVMLPVWHNITREEMAQYSSTLADRLAMRSDADSLLEIVAELKQLLEK